MDSCSIEGCARPRRKLGMCDTHYANAKRNGRIPPPEPTSCTTCGIAIVPNNRRPRKFCSAQCLRDHHNPIKSEAEIATRAARPRTRSCAECGRLVHRRSIDAKFCSKACNDRAQNRINRPCKIAGQERRRARLAGVGCETFNRGEIFARDGWICQLCGEPVDRALVFPDPLSASLDHIIPIALNGPHTRLNTQLAHLRCNIRKGARPMEVAA